MREKGWPVPRYQFAFRQTTPGDLTLHEQRDNVLNRFTRVATLRSLEPGSELLAPILLDAQLIELTRERLILSGIERLEEPLILKVEDFAQTWVCWLDV